MKKLTFALAFAALSAAAYAPLAGSSDNTLAQAFLPAPQRPAPILLAQARGRGEELSCVLDGKKVPIGSTYCKRSKLMLCSGTGSWTDTGKPC